MNRFNHFDYSVMKRWWYSVETKIVFIQIIMSCLCPSSDYMRLLRPHPTRVHSSTHDQRPCSETDLSGLSESETGEEPAQPTGKQIHVLLTPSQLNWLCNEMWLYEMQLEYDWMWGCSDNMSWYRTSLCVPSESNHNCPLLLHITRWRCRFLQRKDAASCPLQDWGHAPQSAALLNKWKIQHCKFPASWTVTWRREDRVLGHLWTTASSREAGSIPTCTSTNLHIVGISLLMWTHC